MDATHHKENATPLDLARAMFAFPDPDFPSDPDHWPEQLLLVRCADGRQIVTDDDRCAAILADHIELPSGVSAHTVRDDDGCALILATLTTPDGRPALSSGRLTSRMWTRLDRAGLDACGSGGILTLWRGTTHYGWVMAARAGRGLSRREWFRVTRHALRDRIGIDLESAGIAVESYLRGTA